jgi:acyl dehydratase
MNLLGQPAFVGRHCGSHEYDITREVVDFYADALDDHHPLYAELAPPLLHHSECYKVLGEWYLKNLFGNLHARQDWELFAPIRIGSRVRTRSTIVDRYAKRGRDYVVNETDLLDAADGRLLVRGRTHQSFLPPKQKGGEGGFVVDASTAKQKQQEREERAGRTPEARAPFPTATGPELGSVHKKVDQRRCWMFSGPSANYHTDAEQAKKLGFPNIVVQGMMTTCFAAQVMLDAFGRGFLEGGRMSLKLTNVLWVDESVTARARIRERTPEGTRVRVHCDVWVDKDDGTRILLGDASALEASEARSEP